MNRVNHSMLPSWPISAASAARLLFGQAVIIKPASVALNPRIRHPLLEPRRCHHGQRIKGMAQGFADAFEAIEVTNGLADMGRVGTHLSASTQEACLAELCERGIKQEPYGIAVQEPSPKFAQHRGVEPQVVEGQT